MSGWTVPIACSRWPNRSSRAACAATPRPRSSWLMKRSRSRSRLPVRADARRGALAQAGGVGSPGRRRCRRRTPLAMRRREAFESRPVASAAERTEVLNALGMIAAARGDLAGAEEVLLRAQSSAPATGAFAVQVTNNLGAVAAMRGDRARAEAFYLTAQKSGRRRGAAPGRGQEPRHPAKCAMTPIGRYRCVLCVAASLAFFLAANRVHAQTAPSTGWQALDDRTEALYVAGQIAEAVTAARAALAAANGPRETGRSRGRLGFLLQTAGNLPEAEQHLRESLKIREAAFGANSLDYAESAHDLALWERDSGHPVEARTLAEQSVAIRRKHLPPTDTAFPAEPEHARVGLRHRRRLPGGRAHLRGSHANSRGCGDGQACARRIRHAVRQPRLDIPEAGKVSASVGDVGQGA